MAGDADGGALSRNFGTTKSGGSGDGGLGAASAEGGGSAAGASGLDAAAPGSSAASLGGGAAGTFLGRPPALREGPAPSTLLLFGFGMRTPLALGMVPFEHRPVRLLREGAAQGTMSVRKELAKRLGQLFPASHRPRRCAYQRRWYQTAGSAHVLDTVGLGEPRVNLGDGKRAL